MSGDLSSSNVRAYIQALLEKLLDKYTIWDSIKEGLVSLYANIPNVNPNEKGGEIADKLQDIYDYLISKGVEEDKIAEFKEDIDSYRLTRQISLYEAKEDRIDPKLVNKFIRIAGNTQGVTGINLQLNYRQLSKLSNAVFQQTQLVKFYISREFTTMGKIVAEIYDHPQDIPVATLLQSKKEVEPDSEVYREKIILFGDLYDKKKWKINREIGSLFYVYRFITGKDKEYVLLSETKKDIGDYLVSGVTTQVTDWKMLSDSARMPTKLPYLFAQNIEDRIIKFKNKGDFKKRLGELNVTKKNIFDLPFSVKRGDKRVRLQQPLWFKWLIWAWLTHSAQGMFNKYPLHIMMIGEHHSGKSLLLNSLHSMSKEVRDIFSGSSSTLKSLVPSFKYRPAKMGYLPESNRFSYCDEFLRCLIRNGKPNGDNKVEEVAIMNDLLEHQKREAGSGISRIKVNMTSRVISATNPIKGIHNLNDLLHSLDASFLSRWLVYYQLRSHTMLIRKSNDDELPSLDYDISDDDWVSFLDFLHSFDAIFDKERVMALYDKYASHLNDDLAEHYSARHKHHIVCIMDGIVKTRSMMEHEMGFRARDEDYKVLETVWSKIIASWIGTTDIKKIPIKDRLQYLPENAQFVFKKIVEYKKPILRSDLAEFCLADMTADEFNESGVILLDNGLITDYDGFLRPYYMVGGK